MIPLYKGKGEGKGEVCGNYRGITLLSSAGKILAGILLSRLNAEIVKTILPESQCRFRQNRGTTDMIFTARQIQEKCSEHRQDLYQVFVDLTKAFDSVNRETLWKILGKLGCPDHFVKLIRSFHDEMEVSVNVGGTLTDPFKVETGVKQGDLLAPTLFSVFFSMMTLSESAIRECTSDTGALENFLTYDASLPKPKFYWRLFVTSSTQMTVTWSHIQNPIWIDYRKHARRSASRSV